MKTKYGPYSPSRLETATCGYAFQRTYIDRAAKTTQLASLPQERGSAVHEVFEYVTKKMCLEKNPSFESEELRSEIAKAINKFPSAYQEVGEIMEMVALYIRKPPIGLTKNALTELRLAVTWDEKKKDFVECEYDDPDAFMRGRADVLDISADTTIATIIDHKTQPNIEEADTFQMAIYVWVIWKIYPFLEEVRTVLHFARYGRYSEEYVWTKNDLGKIEDEILTRVGIVESRTEWKATPYKNCQYCEIKLECPVVKEFIELRDDGTWAAKPNNFKTFGDTDKAVALAGLINITEEVTKKAKDGLREHIKLSGVGIAIPGKVYEFRASDSVDWDRTNSKLKGQLMEYIKSNGKDPARYMGFSQTFTKGIFLDEDSTFVEGFRVLLPVSSSTEFRGSKV
jgi:CRISPR/Cas system-associated exonuclease Cas4 (RecB family)